MNAGIHLGWIGGALSPLRTDWSMIKKAGVKFAIIVADNDAPGKSAVPAIARSLNLPCSMIQFTNEFPSGFDLADPFPKKLLGNVDGVEHYVGPSFRACLVPATWATDLIPNLNGKGRPVAVLRDSFKGQWVYVEQIDSYVNLEMPDRIRSEAILNKMLAPFSHVVETARLINRNFQGQTVTVCYRPDEPGILVTARDAPSINLHVRPTLRSHPGDPQPWLEFLQYMFVNESERHAVMRWCATLIARPSIRMSYGLLLVSEKQGIGKTTLGAHILAPLLGEWNVSFPSESDINSTFNEWIAHKRLAIISEIYAGQSWKVYNTLKSAITDKDITVNRKHQRQYVIENWCHIFASSNSMRALKIENDDRRWFYPEVTEIPWPSEKFVAFRQWLQSGGLKIILHWAEDFDDYVAPHERAPMTERKKELIEASRSEAQSLAYDKATDILALDKPAAVEIKHAMDWCRDHVQGRLYDSDSDIRRVMVEAGLIALRHRFRVNRRLTHIVVNPQLYDILKAGDLLDKPPRDVSSIIRDYLITFEREL